MIPRSINELDAWLADSYRGGTIHARRYRVRYSLGAVAVLSIGLAISLGASEVRLGQFGIHWIILNTLVAAPIAIALTAFGLRLSARMANVELPFRLAFNTCCIATASNVLPIPAGSLIHTSALVSRGGSASQSSIIIIFSNLVSLGWIVLFAGITLFIDWPWLAASSAGIGGTVVLVGALALVKHAPLRLVTAFMTLSILRAAVLVARILLSFAALGVCLKLTDAILFSAAAAAGAVVVVAPSGMGVSESLAAFLSLATEIQPAQAFVAVAINNLTALLFAGIIAIGLLILATLKR